MGQVIWGSPPGQSVGSAGHPSVHRQGPAPPRRPLLGPPPGASHDGPTASPGLGGASPEADMEEFMRVGLGERRQSWCWESRKTEGWDIPGKEGLGDGKRC